MSEPVKCKINKLEFTDPSQTKVHLDIEVASDAPDGAIVFLFAAVGAEPPQLVRQSKHNSGRLEATVPIDDTRALVLPGQGNKPVAVTAYACWTFDEEQARRWIMAKAAFSMNAGTLYLK